jgi:hypothetical protein
MKIMRMKSMGKFLNSYLQLMTMMMKVKTRMTTNMKLERPMKENVGGHDDSGNRILGTMPMNSRTRLISIELKDLWHC